MATIERVYPGDSQPYTIEIRDSANALFDPDIVKVHVKANDGFYAEYAYIGVNNEIVKNSMGMYTFTMAYPYESATVGRWNFDVQALDDTGTPVSKKVMPFTEIVHETGTF